MNHGTSVPVEVLIIECRKLTGLTTEAQSVLISRLEALQKKYSVELATDIISDFMEQSGLTDGEYKFFIEGLAPAKQVPAPEPAPVPVMHQVRVVPFSVHYEVLDLSALYPTAYSVRTVEPMSEERIYRADATRERLGREIEETHPLYQRCQSLTPSDLDDVGLVMSQSGASAARSLEAYLNNDSDIVNAIMELY